MNDLTEYEKVFRAPLQRGGGGAAPLLVCSRPDREQQSTERRLQFVKQIVTGESG